MIVDWTCEVNAASGGVILPVSADHCPLTIGAVVVDFGHREGCGVAPRYTVIVSLSPSIATPRAIVVRTIRATIRRSKVVINAATSDRVVIRPIVSRMSPIPGAAPAFDIVRPFNLNPLAVTLTSHPTSDLGDHGRVPYRPIVSIRSLIWKSRIICSDTQTKIPPSSSKVSNRKILGHIPDLKIADGCIRSRFHGCAAIRGLCAKIQDDQRLVAGRVPFPVSQAQLLQGIGTSGPHVVIVVEGRPSLGSMNWLHGPANQYGGKEPEEYTDSYLLN